MRVLVFHGYLLRGTGSNVYNASLCAALAPRRAQRRPAVPGAPARGARLRRRGRARGRGAGARVATAARAGPRDGVAARHRPPAAGLRRRSLRGLRGAHAAGVQRRRGRGLRRRPTSPPCATCARAPRPDVALANHLVMGPGDRRPRAGRRRALRGQGARQRAGVRRQARSRALPAVGARGPGARRATVLVGSRHTGESLWAAMDDDGAARAHAPGAARASTSTSSARATTPPRASRR